MTGTYHATGGLKIFDADAVVDGEGLFVATELGRFEELVECIGGVQLAGSKEATVRVCVLLC